tara:strand:+ start:543 stop:1778 length:1236 start_codon:yes stop_codon:yes gene_type:complete
MITWFIWIVSFISLYVGVFWLHVITMKDSSPKKKGYTPNVSVLIPAWNEEKGLWKTVHSIVSLAYPKDKLEIIIIDHGSTDKTPKIAKELQKTFFAHRIKIVRLERKKGDIKAMATNAGLRKANGEYVACVDADCIVMQNSLRQLMPYFADEDVAAVISSIKVTQPRNIYEKIQHLEYIFATFTRSLMSKIDTLHITQGALSVFRKDLLNKYGGFDENNMTEDFEIAMRLRYHGHKIKIANESVSYTAVPATFSSLFNQRVRWFRGFLYNTAKYKDMTFNKKYGLLGKFQYPLNILSVVTVLVMFSLLTFTLGKKLLASSGKLQSIGWDYFHFQLPNLKELLLNLNITLIFPIFVSFCVALVIYHLAHKNLKEKWQFPGALIAYVTVYPFVRGMHWMTAFYKEVLKSRKKW